MDNIVSTLIMFLLLSVPLLYASDIYEPNIKENKTLGDQILQIEDSTMEQWRQGNPMRWLEISAEDISYLDPSLSAPIIGITAYDEYLKPLIGKIKYDASEYFKPRVAVYGDIAILTYNYHNLRKDDNGKLNRTSFWNTTEVYRHIDGNWKIAHTHWSFIKHSLPEKLIMPVPVKMTESKDFSPAEQEIFDLEVTAMERWRKGDPDGFLELSAPDVTYFDTGTSGRINGLEELKALYDKRRGKIAYDVMEFINPRIQMYNDSAILTYQFFSTVLNPDGTIKKRTPWNCTEVFTKIDGEWKIVHTHWSFINGKLANSEI
ncbi:MAG: nuclear transport factor 2 family protein [Acidobacteria bacterium]|nr:nuclear transport factor 2 family protein [Acidobacteriota bacterium]